MRRRSSGVKHLHIGRWIAAVLVVVVSAGALGAYVKYRKVYDSVARVTTKDLGKRPQQFSTTSMNILVFGDDSRAGLDHHAQVVLHTGSDQGEINTDTIMIVHISPGRHRVTVLSIPRDTMVPQYQCDPGPGHPGQQQDLNQFVQINGLLAAGGQNCLWKTVEQTTGIFINHFIEMGFLGFVKVINDLGGVNVCVPFNVDDPTSGLQLKTGEHHINGVQALAFWRTRENLGLGSDLQRIQRDQFMSAQVVQGVLHGGLLNSPTKLLQVVTDAASSMTIDSGMSVTDLLHIGESFRSLSSKNVQFLTAPNQPWPQNQARVEFAQPQADAVFSAIAHDVTVPKSVKAKSTTPATPVATISPAQVKVQVLNGSGLRGAAGQAATALTGKGFDVTGTADATSFNYAASVIEYATAADLPAVNTLKQQLTNATVKQNPALTPGTIELIVGSDFSGLAGSAADGTPAAQPSPSASASPGQDVATLAQSAGGITANASCSSDASAFAGAG
jgi:LCP family protein required for cell wall assembly